MSDDRMQGFQGAVSGGFADDGSDRPATSPFAPPKVISLEELRLKAMGVPVEIPDWEPGKTIWVRAKPIDMTPYMLQFQALPNKLKTAAVEVFHGEDPERQAQAQRTVEELGQDSIAQMLPLLDQVARDTLTEPTFDEIQALLPMTLNQKMALFQHALGGLDMLESFRTGLGQNDRAGGGSAVVPSTTE